MRSELRDKVADLLVEAIQHRERSILIYWLRAYCQVVKAWDAPAVPFSRWAEFVRRRPAEVRWCGSPDETWGRRLVADSGLFRLDEADRIAIAPEYRQELPRICGKAVAYWDLLKKLHRGRPRNGLGGVLWKAALLWEHRLFFEFHEILEGVWMDWRGPERSFLQGLIQLGVAFYHIQRNNHRGAMSMFRNGGAKVAPHQPRFCGVELKRFLQRIDKCRRYLEDLGPDACDAFDWSLVPPLRVGRAS